MSALKRSKSLTLQTRITGAVAALLAFACLILQAEAQQVSMDEAAVYQAEDDWINAEISRDEATLRRVIDDRFVFNSSSGETSGKEDLIAAVLDWHMTGQTITERSILVDGDAAVIFGTTELRFAVTGADDHKSLLRYTSTYKKRDGQWRAIALHMSKYAREEQVSMHDELIELGKRYTAAWNGGEPTAVAAFFAESGSLFVNGEPSRGRVAITAVAESFMSGFPDMQLSMDDLVIEANKVTYHWTFTGTNTGPDGSGKAVRFSGYEEWTIGDDGLIVESLGNFDNTEYQRQLEHGIE
jgi:ketosteroid isomerase-like protein